MEDGLEEELEDEMEDAEKVKRSKVTFDFLQYEQMENDIPKGLMRNAIINNKPLYNVRTRTINYNI